MKGSTKKEKDDLVAAITARLQTVKGSEEAPEDELRRELAGAVCELVHMESLEKFLISFLADVSPLPNVIDRRIFPPLVTMIQKYLCEKAKEVANGQ